MNTDHETTDGLEQLARTWRFETRYHGAIERARDGAWLPQAKALVERRAAQLREAKAFKADVWQLILDNLDACDDAELLGAALGYAPEKIAADLAHERGALNVGDGSDDWPPHTDPRRGLAILQYVEERAAARVAGHAAAPDYVETNEAADA